MIGRLATAINYPEEIPEGIVQYLFRVDGLGYAVEILGSRLVVKFRLDISGDEIVTFATFAAGRMLREEAILAWDKRSQEAFLWQELPVHGSSAELAAAFGAFVDACEWWADRVEALRVPASVFPKMMIQP